MPKFLVGSKSRIRVLWDADHGIVADLIALGTAMAIGTCGGPPIPLRGGRIDATEAGAAGVCQPETDLQTTLASFSGAGFNPADTIALTACGHTMGGYVCQLTLNEQPLLLADDESVHHSTFPQISKCLFLPQS